jgi:transcriptional regulator with XRE-family HTH domain
MPEIVGTGRKRGPMTDLQRRIARARLLRREGKTYDEIRAALDVPVSDDRLQGWLKGIPRPPGTRRSCPKTELRSECRRLRAQGLTYDEIAAKTGASKGSISPWVRDVTPPHGVHRERLEHTRDSRRMEALRESARTRSRLAARRRELHSDVAAASIGPLADLELFLVGVALYWAEGTKSKPVRPTRTPHVRQQRSVDDRGISCLAETCRCANGGLQISRIHPRDSRHSIRRGLLGSAGGPSDGGAFENNGQAPSTADESSERRRKLQGMSGHLRPAFGRAVPVGFRLVDGNARSNHAQSSARDRLG